MSTLEPVGVPVRGGNHQFMEYISEDPHLMSISRLHNRVVYRSHMQHQKLGFVNY